MTQHHEENYPLNTQGSNTLVIHCSDPRFQEAFGLFLREELALTPGSYDPIVIPGASQMLAFADLLPKFASGLSRPLEFLVKGHGLKRVVVIMHEDCAWYRDFVPKFLRQRGTIKEQQFNDLLQTKMILREKFPHIETEMFYASINPPGRVTFTKVKETGNARG